MSRQSRHDKERLPIQVNVVKTLQDGLVRRRDEGSAETKQVEIHNVESIEIPKYYHCKAYGETK